MLQPLYLEAEKYGMSMHIKQIITYYERYVLPFEINNEANTCFTFY